MTSAKHRRSLYEVLGLHPGASLADIRRAHKEKVKARHPDTGGSAEAFMETQHAYVVLRDPERRAEYDRTGEDPGEAVDQRESQVLGVIAVVMDKLLAQPLESILPSDCIQTMQDFMQREIAEIGKAKGEHVARMKKLEKLVRRFRRRDGEVSANALSGMVQFQIENAKRALTGLDDAIALRREAISLLKDYQFDSEMPQMVGQAWGQNSGWNVFGGLGNGPFGGLGG